MRYKVLFLTPWYPSVTNPMHGIFVREQALAVEAYDDIIVSHIRRNQEINSPSCLLSITDHKYSKGIPTYQILIRSARAPSINYLRFLISTHKAYNEITSSGFQPEIVHAHTYHAGVPAAIISKIHNLPYILTVHSSSFLRSKFRINDSFKAKFAIQNAQIVLPVSQALSKSIQKFKNNAFYNIIPNAVDTSLFYPKEPSRSHPRVKTLLFTGSLIPVKGLDRLLYALAELHLQRIDWRLQVVGEGSHRSEYEALVSQLGLDSQVIFYGYQSKRQIADFMRSSDIYVLPSRIETFSVSTAEALATGTPVLATRCGGPEDYLTEDVGLLVDNKDHKSLITGLTFMLDNFLNFNPVHTSNIARKRFSYEIIGKQIHNVYQSVLEGTRG